MTAKSFAGQTANCGAEWHPIRNGDRFGVHATCQLKTGHDAEHWALIKGRSGVGGNDRSAEVTW